LVSSLESPQRLLTTKKQKSKKLVKKSILNVLGTYNII
jgi:hypothetical protein